MSRMTRSAQTFAAHGVDCVFSDSGHAYSLERFVAFRAYCAQTSRLRVLLVLTLTLSAPLLLLAAYDVVPLQDPDAGWQTNSVFWARTFVNAIVVCGSIMVQATLVIPAVLLTARRMVVIVAIVSVGYTGALLLLAHNWDFPVPFTFTMGGIPFCISMAAAAMLVLGTADRAQLSAFLRFANNIAVQTSMMLVYPTYNAIFLRLHGPSQLAFVLVLPVMKYSFKRAIAKVQTADADLVPAILSSVDIFDALYMTKCMQSAGSIEVGLGIIAIDVAQNVVAMVGLARQTRTIRAMFAHQDRAASRIETVDTDERDQHTSMFFRFLMRNVQQLDADAATRSLQCAPPREVTVSSESQEQRSQLRLSSRVTPAKEIWCVSTKLATTLASNSNSNKTRCVVGRSKKKWIKRSSTVVPTVATLVQSPTTAWTEPSSREQQDVVTPMQLAAHEDCAPATQSLASKAEQTKHLVYECVRLLHESEALGVIEYIETVIPVFYALYISFLFRLPNAKYYEDMREFTPERLHAVVGNILLYSLLELLSLAWVHCMLQRAFGISLFYQIAFTLEREWRLFQCNFVSWILVVFQFLLLHNGADYSFEFRWMNGGSVFSHAEHNGTSTSTSASASSNAGGGEAV